MNLGDMRLKQGVILVAGSLIALLLKFYLFDYEYVDYVVFLSQWVSEIKANGYLHALKEPFYNYTPAYMYILTVIAKLDLYPLYAIKFASVFFEFILAYFIGRLAFLYFKKENYFLIAFLAVLFIPTVLLNSSFMSQCDSIYASFAIGSIYFALTKRNWTAMILLGIAFCFKAQTAVILPFYFVYMLRGHIKWYYFLLVPIIYFISVIPVWAVGRPLSELLTIYIGQSDYNKTPVGSFANFYMWVWIMGGYFKEFGLIFTTLLTLIGGYLLSNKKYNFTIETWLKLALLSAIICPFFLPGMLERYMYIGDMLAILYAMMRVRNIFASIGIITVSFLSYCKVLYLYVFYGGTYSGEFFGLFWPIPWRGISLIYIVVIIYVSYDLWQTLRNNMQKEIV